MNIGAGRVVEQWLLRISRALEGDSLNTDHAYQQFLRAVADAPQLHLIGLYSDGGVHSHFEHLHLLLDRLANEYHGTVVLHLITDGRDTAPRAALAQVQHLEGRLQRYSNVRIATVSGRFYAMDRDKRWERTQQAYRTIALAEGPHATSASAAIAQSYSHEVSDEFIVPTVIAPHPIGAQDAVLFWNFREDRVRQIVAALAAETFEPFSRPAPMPQRERVLCFTEYDHRFDLPFLFAPLAIPNYLGAVVSAHGHAQLRVAETEKYPHVTYFLNVGREEPLPGEERTMIPSPREVATYDQKPEMSALEVTRVVTDALRSEHFPLVVVNLANCDMVGHSGNFNATVRAVETVDSCLTSMLATLERVRGNAVILADHGNAELMIDYRTGSPHTAHTTFAVPLFVVGPAAPAALRNGGALKDVAPTVLDLLGIETPQEMTGCSLLARP